ncbi:unnamed protein product [Alopecurus aequalis]
MAPASASLFPGTAKRTAAAVSDAAAEHPPTQDGVAAGKTNQSSQQLECPRCKSGNTKFCYYNNYSTTQPRHFCRACRRYWTHGGTLRNVPVGGACRRGGNKRRRSTEPSPSSGSPAEDACRPDMLPEAPPFFPFLSDGAVFLPQFDLGLGGSGVSAAFPWTSALAAPDHIYDGLAAAPWGGGGGGGGDGTLSSGAWDEAIELTWPLQAGN